MNNKIYFEDLRYSDCAGSNFSFSKIKSFFRINNYTITEDIDEAGYIIFNTCGVFIEYEELFFRDIEEVRKKYGQTKKIIVFWCLAWHSKKIWDICDYIIPTKKEKYFEDIFSFQIPFSEISSILVNIDENVGIRNTKYDEEKERYYLQVNRGCIHNCTYCGIKKSIGYVKSKPLDEIKQEVIFALNNNFKELYIITDDIASYWQDIGTNFAEMYNLIASFPWDYKININYAEPSEFMKWFPHIADNFYRVNSITYPIQSFNDRILKLMARKYTVQDFIESVMQMRKYNESIVIRNHIIFWYPTEDFEEFRNNLLWVYIFDESTFLLYSKIPGTKIFNESEYIKPQEIKKRIYAIYKLSKSNPRIYELYYRLADFLSHG